MTQGRRRSEAELRNNNLEQQSVVRLQVQASSESCPLWVRECWLPCWKTHQDGWLAPGLHRLGETYLLTYKLDACVTMQSGIFVIIASRRSCKLFMGRIQCKQVRAHIPFSLTLLVLDHAGVQLLRELLLSMHILKGGPCCPQCNHSQQRGQLLTLCLKVQWANTVPLPALTPAWPGWCQVISDMKADRSPSRGREVLRYLCAETWKKVRRQGHRWS